MISEITTLWCIGKNYQAHAQEMGGEAPTSPVVFLKSPASISTGAHIHLPSWTQNVHHELEIAVRIGKNNAPSHIALALDLTARDIQTELKAQGLPWARAKSFPQSCPLSEFVPYEGDAWFESLTFELAVNSTIRQFGSTKDMVFKLPEILSHLEAHYPVREGDLVLTGTPEGVGPLMAGDALHGALPGILQIDWLVK